MLKIKNKLLSLLIGLTTLLSLYALWTYQSLQNPIKEIHFSEVSTWSGILFPYFGKVVGSSQSYRSSDIISHIQILSNDLKKEEKIYLNIARHEPILLEYQKELSKDTYLFVNYTYRENVFRENISICFTSISDQSAEQKLEISRRKGNNIDKKMIYQFSSNPYNDKKSITKPSEVLEFLKPYHLDKSWLKSKSDFLLKDAFLKPWFEKGSQRYSFENLGNLKIERSELVADD